MKNGKRSTVKRKFFPSYILVEMIMNKETQHFINSIPGVTRFIGGTPLKPAAHHQGRGRPHPRSHLRPG